jgi:hypothetical protein
MADIGRRVWPAGALLLLAGVAAARPVPEARYVVFPGARAAELLNQCSRAAPRPGSASWQPTSQDIAALEKALPDYLVRLRPADAAHWRNVLQEHKRQYVGIIRRGTRSIYGNFFPDRLVDASYNSPSERARWKTGAMVICDGGPDFFGVEYEVTARRFIHADFNGMI